MNKINPILKNLLPGLIPLFVFIIAEEIWELETGLIIALTFGLAELIYVYIKTKKIEKFIITDIILLTILGVISFVLNNDIFFKLKPALIESILAIILGISVFGPKNLIMAMSKRYMKDMEINQAAENQMIKSFKILFYITIVHIVTIIYSAYKMSDEAWAFISGGLFYIIFIGYFGFEFLKNKYKATKHKNEEWLPLVDKEGNIIGKAPRSHCHSRKDKPLHPVVHMHVFDRNGNIYLQKRSMNKLIQPGKWDTAVGGHIAFGEKIEVSLEREAKEEIGLVDFEPQFLRKYIWESDMERELIFMFKTNTYKKLLSSNNEIDEGRYWKIKDIKKNLGKGIFTPNFEHEFKLLTI